LPVHDRKALRDALWAYAAVLVLVTAFVRIDVTVAFVGHVGSALVAVVLLYAPVFVGWRRGEDLHGYGFHADPIGRGLAFGLGAPLIIFPLFALAYFGFYELVCDTETLRALAPPAACRSFHGFEHVHAPHVDLDFAQFALVQLVVVALPEELFFRGCVLGLLERALPPKRRILGGGIGWALLISSAMFAVVHLPREADPRTLATFFPGLLFGWMRSATGSILAPVMAHAASNVFIRLLDQMVLR
jgi:membrane protease YdiL (CAAX protease family)